MVCTFSPSTLPSVHTPNLLPNPTHSNKVQYLEQVVATMSDVVQTERRNRQRTALRELERSMKEGLCGRYFNRLAAYSAKHGTREKLRKLRKLEETTAGHIYSRSFTQWRRHHKAGIRSRRLASRARCLTQRNEFLHMKHAWSCLVHRHNIRRNTAFRSSAVLQVVSEDLCELNRHSMLSTFYRRLQGYAWVRGQRMRFWEDNVKALVKPFFAFWSGGFLLWRMWGRRRRERVGAMRKGVEVTVLAGYQRKWRRFVVRRRELRRAWDGVKFIRASSAKQLVSRFLLRWQRCCTAHNTNTILQERVDVGLTTLANTNNVLDTIVTKVLTHDHTLDRIDKEKIGRHELTTLLESAASPSIRQEAQQVNNESMTAALGTARDLLAHDAVLYTEADELVRGHQRRSARQPRVSSERPSLSPPFSQGGGGDGFDLMSHRSAGAFTNLSEATGGTQMHAARSRSASISVGSNVPPAVAAALQKSSVMPDQDTMWAAHFANIQSTGRGQ